MRNREKQSKEAVETEPKCTLGIWLQNWNYQKEGGGHGTKWEGGLVESGE